MVDYLTDWQFWLRSFHIIAVISWMAGMLYLPRLFVYHAGVEAGSETSETFKVMERRLLRAIMTPAMIVAWIFGILLLWQLEFSQLGFGWMQVKLVCVLALSALHGMFAGTVRRFAEDRNVRSARTYRILNEIPTILMIAIVFLVFVGSH